MLMYWVGSSQTASPREEGRYEAMGRLYQRSTACRNPQSERGVHGRKERDRPSGPSLVFYFFLFRPFRNAEAFDHSKPEDSKQNVHMSFT